MMKTLRHIFLCGLLIPLTLVALSCQKDAEPRTDHDVALTLKVKIADDPLTKVTTPADDSRNENVISWVDIFLFSGAGGTGTEVYRTPYQSLHPVQDALDPTVYTLSLHLPSTRVRSLFGTTDPGAGNSAAAKIAVVANGDAVSAGDYMVYPSAATSSVQAVRESVAKTNFDAWYAENLSYLIMCGSGDITLAHTVAPDEITATGTIPMTRAYAKLDIALILPDSGQLEFSGRTYRANLSTMKIELLNVVHRGYAGSDETHVMDLVEGDFLPTTNQRSLTAAGSPLTATHNCFYSYPRLLSDVPDKEMAYRIAIEWQATDAGVGDPVHTGYYSFPVVDEDNETALYANHYYHSEATIHTLGSADLDDPEELEGTWSILPWGSAPIFGKFNDYQYLIAQPTYVPMHGITMGTARYKSSSPLRAVDGYAITSVVTYGTDATGAETSRTITNPTDLARYSLTHDADANTITLHHNLELEGDPMYYRQEITVTLQNNNGLSETIVFEQAPPIEVRSTGHQGSTANFFIDGLTIHQFEDQGFSQTGSGSTSYPDDQYRIPPPEESTAALRYNLRFTVSSFSSDNGQYVYGDPAAISPDLHEYKIGDPRISQSKFTTTQFNNTWSRTSWFTTYTVTTYTWTEEQLGGVLIADPSASAADIIAPEFICSSGLATSYPLSRDQSEMRAAMYQESGYPAGRWRLMTEAEFKFLADLQCAGKIPSLFLQDDTRGYWTAQGTCYRFTSGTSYVSVSVSESTTGHARFVYDTWYWGPDPDDDHVTTYLPQP